MKNIKCYDSNGNALEYMYQWDSNQTIVMKNLGLSSAPNCHFSNRNRKTALVVPSDLLGSDVVVSVPNYLLQEAVPVLLHVNCNLSDGSSKTLYRAVVPVIPRPRPSEYDDSNTEIVGTSDANAVSSDIVAGKTAYARGAKLTGSMERAASALATVGKESGYIALKGTYTDKRYIDPSTGMTLLANPSDFGDATSKDVAKGKFFTSASGLKVEGSAVMSGGIDTSDATATAADIAWKKTAYVNGKKVTGEISESPYNTMATPHVNGPYGEAALCLEIAPQTDRIVRVGTVWTASCPLSALGNATAADVAKGVFFTSREGFMKEGQAEFGTGGGGFSVTDDGNGNVVITSASVTDNNGDVVIS